MRIKEANMAKNPRKSQAGLSKKHLDRLHREQMQTRWIMIGSAVVVVLVVGLILYGVLEQSYFKYMRTVATVNGEKISANEFRSFTKYYRNNLIQNAQNTFQLASMFGSDPSSLQSFGNQLVQISDELEAERAGQQALDQLIDDKLVRQEAKKEGITVSSQEFETGVEEALRYYANGTPTPTPTSPPILTSTLSPTQLAMIPPTSTPAPTATATATLTNTGQLTSTQVATPTLVPTATPTMVITTTATPLPTSTPYTYEGYQQVYSTLVANLATVEIPEQTLRYVIESRLIQDKLMEKVLGPVDCTQDQVWAQHILVNDEKLAQDIRQRALNGEDWFKLASTYSTDTSNKDKGGDLGWFGAGQMVPEFEAAAFALTTPGQISEPVKTQFGWHIIRLIAHEKRSISASECSSLRQQKFQEYISQLRSDSDVQIFDVWKQLFPLQPTLPPDIQQAVAQLRSINATQPAVPPGFSTPAP
jgi:peptidyl-prolyl cis-trans isomerase D